MKITKLDKIIPSNNFKLVHKPIQKIYYSILTDNLFYIIIGLLLLFIIIYYYL